MMDVAYALVMALLHSLWQSGLLLLLYKTLSQGLMRQTTPLFRRNALLSIVAIQLLITITTCSIYYTAGEAPANWTGWVNIEHHQLKAFLYPLAPWLFTVYLCWITGRLLYLGVQWVRFKKGSARGLVKPAIHLRLFTDVKAAHLGIRRKVNVWLSTAIDTPITFGWLKPVILLPVALVNQLTIPQTEALLLHELAHIRVNDYCYNWLLSLVEIIFFFNPFVRSLCHEARLEREKHCDTTVIQFNYSPLAYAESLLLAAHLQQRPVCLQPAAVSGKQQLLQRIRFFTHRNALPFTQNRLHMAMTGLLTTVVAAIVILISGPAFPVGKLGTGSGANVLMIHHPASLWLASGNTETVIATIAPPPEMRTAELSIPRIPNRPASTPMEADHADIGKKDKISRPATAPAHTSEDMAGTIAGMRINDMVPVFEKAGFAATEPAKEVIIEEEIAGSGKKALRVYLLRYKNGQWQLIPQLLAESRQALVDTMLLRADSLQLKVLLKQQ